MVRFDKYGNPSQEQWCFYTPGGGDVYLWESEIAKKNIQPDGRVWVLFTGGGAMYLDVEKILHKGQERRWILRG